MGNAAAGQTQSSPIKVAIAGVSSIGAGGTHALAVLTDGTVWGWGNNNTGQLGDGGGCGKTCVTPVRAAGVANAAGATGGYVHTLAVLADGSLRGSGRNAEGELGDGTTTARLSPVAVAGLSGVKAAPPVNATYRYDGTGLRASRTAGGLTQQFAWQLADGLPVLLTDGVTSYLYDDGGTPVEQVDAAGSALYYQHDQYNSTRLLTSQAGALTATFTFDAYGGLTAKTGTADTPLRCNGQYQDNDTGLYYLRARYYDPATAQFLTRDPLVATTGTPYSYSDNGPLDGADPFGLNKCEVGANPWRWIGNAVDCGDKAGGWVADNSEEIGRAASGAAAALSTAALGCTAVLAATGAGELVYAVVEGGSLVAGAVATTADIIAAKQGKIPVYVPIVDAVGLGTGIAGNRAPLDGYGIWTSGLGKYGLNGVSAAVSIGAYADSFVSHCQ